MTETGKESFLFAIASRPVFVSTQPPIQWVPGLPGVKQHLPPASAEVKESVELYLHSPLHLHGMGLS
jgi:hypothetical protein